MSTTSKGVAKKLKKRIFLLLPGKECNALEKKLAPQLCNDYFAVSRGVLKPVKLFLPG
jgi:hypothetical protein